MYYLCGLKEYYSAEEMTGKSVVFVANLKPRKLRGVMSKHDVGCR